MRTCLLISCLVVLLLTPLPGQAQGSLETRYGHVVGKHEIKGDSNVAKGAVIGGIVGLVTASGKSSNTKVKRTAGGAILGGVIANQVDKSKRHWQYTIRFPGGGETRLAVQDDQLELGDCAAVHEGVEQTSVAYASDYFCRPDAQNRQRADQQQREQRDDQSDADDPCLEAKRRLLDSEDQKETEILVEKVKVICDQGN